MIDKLNGSVARHKVWSLYTNYPSAVGLHSEVSKNAVAMHSSTMNELSRTCVQIENMHRREMRVFRNDKKHLEKSMLAYSERMKRISRERLNQGLIKPGRIKDNSPTRANPITPLRILSEQKEAVPRQKKDTLKYLDNVLQPSRSISKAKVLKRSGSVSPRPYMRLKPVVIRPRTDDRPTLPVSEISSDHTGESVHGLRRSRDPGHITNIWSENRGIVPASTKSVKVTAAMPIAAFKPVYGMDEARDSGYSSTEGSVSERSEHGQPQETQTHDMPSEVKRLEISPFPDILNQPNNLDDEGLPEETPLKIDLLRLKQENRRLYKAYERTPRARVCSKDAVASTKRKIKNRKPQLVRQSFRYSYAVGELLMKPNRLLDSETHVVSKTEVEKGQIVQTLGHGVLTFDGDGDNVDLRGLKINRKRDCASAPIPCNNDLKPERSCIRPSSEKMPAELKKTVDFKLPDNQCLQHQMSAILEEPEKIGSFDESINKNKAIKK